MTSVWVGGQGARTVLKLSTTVSLLALCAAANFEQARAQDATDTIVLDTITVNARKFEEPV